jgi:NADPH2:quinone reductase
MKAIVVHAHGGPEALVLDEVPDPTPEPDEAVVEVAASGVNFLDVYYRKGAFKLEPPFIPGSEACGTVIATGTEVSDDLIGKRVVFVTYPSLHGTYAERVRVKAWRLVPIGPALDDAQAATLMMAGMTAHYLANDIRPIAPGDRVLVHAAAGGVGSLLVQMLAAKGARVIGATSSSEKAELVRGRGASTTVLTTGEWAEDVRRITEGEGVDVVFDSVGRATFDGSLDSLRRRGWMVLFGISSGPPRDLPPEELLHRGSLVLTRPGLVDFTRTPQELQDRAQAVIALAEGGDITLQLQEVIPMSEVARAHQLLEQRATTGKLVLDVRGSG